MVFEEHVAIFPIFLIYLYTFNFSKMFFKSVGSVRFLFWPILQWGGGGGPNSVKSAIKCPEKLRRDPKIKQKLRFLNATSGDLKFVLLLLYLLKYIAFPPLFEE